jgi:predicted GIY-YIG superfamily endonuclease
MLEALKYKYRSEFQRKSHSAYIIAKRLGIFNRVTKHMVWKTWPRDVWNLKTISREAKKFKTRSEFMKMSSGAYAAALKLGILNKVCSHTVTPCSDKLRSVYSIEFEDRSVYVGLTVNYSNRLQQHINHDVHKEKMKMLKYKFVKSNDWHNPVDGQIAEKKLIEKYRKNGWIVLNKSNYGSLGRPPKSPNLINSNASTSNKVKPVNG